MKTHTITQYTAHVAVAEDTLSVNGLKFPGVGSDILALFAHIHENATRWEALAALMRLTAEEKDALVAEVNHGSRF